MNLSEKQAEAVYEALSAPARKERARLDAARDLKKRQTMPFTWHIFPALVGLSIAVLPCWILLGPKFLWLGVIGLLGAKYIAQILWNHKVKPN